MSQDAFKAGSLWQLCTHQAPDLKTGKDFEEAEQLCATYLRGLTDGMFVMQLREDSGARNCLGPNAPSITEARTVFETYLAQHPDKLQSSPG